MSPVVTSRAIPFTAPGVMPSASSSMGHHALMPGSFASSTGFRPHSFGPSPPPANSNSAISTAGASMTPVPQLLPSHGQPRVTNALSSAPASQRSFRVLSSQAPASASRSASSGPPVCGLRKGPEALAAQTPAQSAMAGSAAIPDGSTVALASCNTLNPAASPVPPPTPRSGSCASRHMAAEQRRRARINERLEALREIVPHSARANTAAFLTEVYDYIASLQKELDRRSESCQAAAVQDQKQGNKGCESASGTSHTKAHDEVSPVVSPSAAGRISGKADFKAGTGSPNPGAPSSGLDLSLSVGARGEPSSDEKPRKIRSTEDGGCSATVPAKEGALSGAAAPGRSQGRGAFSAYVAAGKQADKGYMRGTEVKGDLVPNDGSVCFSPSSSPKRPHAIEQEQADVEGPASGSSQMPEGARADDMNVDPPGKTMQTAAVAKDSSAGQVNGEVQMMTYAAAQPSSGDLLPRSSEKPLKPGLSLGLAAGPPAAAAAAVAGGVPMIPTAAHSHASNQVLPSSPFLAMTAASGVAPVPMAALPAHLSQPPPSSSRTAASSIGSRKRKESSTQCQDHLQHLPASSSGSFVGPPSAPILAAPSTAVLPVPAGTSHGTTCPAGSAGTYSVMMPMLPPMHPVAMAAAAAAAADAAAAAAVQQWNMAAAVAQAQAQAAVQAHAQAQALVSAVAASSAAAASGVAGSRPVHVPLPPGPGALRSTSPPLPPVPSLGPPSLMHQAVSGPTASGALSLASTPAPPAPMNMPAAAPKRRRRGQGVTEPKEQGSSCPQTQKVVRPIAVRPRP